MDDYMSLTSFTHQPMYLPFQLEIPDNWSHKAAYNVELNEMYEAVLNALKKGYTVGWTADVSEPGFSHKMGLAVLPVDPDTLEVSAMSGFMTPVPEIEVTPELRQKGYDNKTTQDDHLMHIVGAYEDQKGRTYFLVKNSWGTSNYPQGYLFVSAPYFKMKTIYVYMHKACLADKLRKKLSL
jgi:bleomycin hydrolase